MNKVGISWIPTAHLAALAIAAFCISSVLIVLLRPFFRRYWMSHPNGRSSHRKPTPQGGGAAVVAATIIVVGAGVSLTTINPNDLLRLLFVFAATAGLAIVGATDDIRPLEAVPRLFLQVAAAILVIAALPTDLRIIHALPWWLERATILLGIIWFVNLVNFMDGIDWMTVAEVVPVTAGLTLFGLMGILPRDATVVALSLCGAMIGFAPFNRPVARLFLGDVGSLPIGLLLAWLLALLAGNGHLAAALLLPLYYLADATITLLRRIVNGEQIMLAHRSHFYQRAMDGGFSVYQVVARVFVLNFVLVGLATITVLDARIPVHFMALTVGGALVGALLWTFNRAFR